MAGVSPLVDREQLKGAGLVLASTLLASTNIPTVPSAPATYLAMLAADLPLQAVSISPRSRLGQWIRFSAVLEAHGEWSVAWDLLAALQARCRGSAPRSVARRAFLSARLGRVARVAGQIEDAEHWYREAIRMTNTLPQNLRWEDARPHAILGLSILSVGRGNYPRGARLAQSLLRKRAGVPSLYLVQAFLVLALIARKRSDPSAALTFLWEALDRVPHGDPRRTEVLVTLAEIAGDLQQPIAAVRARVAALAGARTPRVASAALAGLLQLLAEVRPSAVPEVARIILRSGWGRIVLDGVQEGDARRALLSVTRAWLDQSSALGLSPHDRVILEIGTLRLGCTLAVDDGEPIDWADNTLSVIDRLASTHAFFERALEVDALRELVTTTRSALSTASDAGELRVRFDASPVVVRDFPPTAESTRARESRTTRVVTRLRRAQFRATLHPRAVLR